MIKNSWVILIRSALFFMEILLPIAGALSSGPSDYYTAGVVEFEPIVSGMSSADIVREHTRSYIEIINSMEANATDIIVFPEGTLNNVLQLTFVPSSSERVSPCRELNGSAYAEFLVELSCAARNARKYVVINLTEKEHCVVVDRDRRPCSNSGFNVFNTNVVFDREGRIVSRYRKFHVYVEDRNTTVEPEFAVFETDFGVRFGHFVCFDLLFYSPAQELVRRLGVQNFILTSYFFSELPFLTAVQLQQSWAWGNDVNLLAAGASFPLSGTTGSGIYAGARGDIVSLMAHGSGQRRLLVAQIPKSEAGGNPQQAKAQPVVQGSRTVVQTEPMNLKLLRDAHIDQFNSELMDIANEATIVDHVNVTSRLCQKGFCCRFAVAATKRSAAGNSTAARYHYRLGVFNGRRTYQKEEWSDLQICALYTCGNQSVTSCGEFIESSALSHHLHFTSLSIEGSFLKADQLLIMPNSLTQQLYPLRADQVEWLVAEESQHYDVSFRLQSAPSDPLLTFAIYANYYEKSTSGPSLSAPLLLSLALFIALARTLRH